MTTPQVDVFTDGACSGNPGPGGWGAILRSGAHEKEISGGGPLPPRYARHLPPRGGKAKKNWSAFLLLTFPPRGGSICVGSQAFLGVIGSQARFWAIRVFASRTIFLATAMSAAL
jgi:hypothetical protein